MDYSRVFLDLTLLLVLSLAWPRTARAPTLAVLALLGLGASAFLLHYTCGKV
jgi:hypothetical protein